MRGRSLRKRFPGDSARFKIAGWLVLVAAFTAAAVYFIHLGQATTFYRDDWYFILYRDGTSLENLLSGHADQQVPGMVAVFVFLYKLVGLSDYVVFRLLAVPVVLGCSALVYYVGSRRMGPWGALAPALVVLLPGASYIVALWPLVTLTFAAPGLLGLAAFLIIEQKSIRGDIAACVLLLLALTFSGYALPFVVGVGVGIILDTDRDLKRLWIPFVPALAYVAWSRIYGTQEIDLLTAAGEVPGYVAKMAVNSIVGVTGLDWTVSAVLAAIFVVFSAYRLFQLRGESQMALTIAAALLSFWVLTALARSETGDPRAIRYIFPSILLMAPLLASISPVGKFKNAFSIGFMILAIAVIPHSIREFTLGSDHLQTASAKTRAQLAAYQIGRETIDPALFVRLASCPGCTLMAGNYFGAIDRYASSPAYSQKQLLDAPESVRESADRGLAKAQAISVSRHGSLPEGLANPSGANDCHLLKPGEPVFIRNLRSHPIVVSGPNEAVNVSLRRFAHRFQAVPRPPGPKESILISAPEDSLDQPAWQARLEAQDQPITVCPGPAKT